MKSDVAESGTGTGTGTGSTIERVPAEADEKALLSPILETGRRFYGTVAVLLAVVLFSWYAYTSQIRSGLSVTGLNRPVMWGFYITNFVFFIGISHAGTLISAILRLCNAEWRRSITRSAEVITVLVLFIGGSNILMDLGRPERALNVFRHGHLRSPLLWDVISISTYLTGSTIYLFLPLIPDIALLRDRTTGLRRSFYRLLALGWTGTERQWRILERAIAVMAVLVIPIAITVHTVVSWVFAMTIQPMWHSTIFGPYFVCGAIFSGIAALIIAMAILRSAYGLEAYLKEVHFKHLGTLLLVMTLLWFYFTFAEHLTTFYGGEPAHMAVFREKVFGRYAAFFWVMVATCFVIPMAILVRPSARTIRGTVVASIAVSVGMWLERFTIVVPTLVNPRMPFDRGVYAPSWVEVALMAGCFAAFALLYVVFSKLFPIVSIWEVREGREHAVAEAKERIIAYLPNAPGSASRPVVAPPEHNGPMSGAAAPARTPPIRASAVVLAFLIVPALAATARADDPRPAEMADWLPTHPLEGKRLFDEKGCAKCHGIWADDSEERVGPDLGRSRLGEDILELAGTLWNHTPQMIEKMRERRVERSTLSPDEMAKLAGFLFYIRFLDEPGDIERGRELFQKRSCTSCHQVGGKGGRVGPRLDEMRPFMSSAFLAQALWDHGPKMAAKMAELKIERPTLEGEDVAHLLAFIRGEARLSGSPARAYAQPGSPQAGRALLAEKGCVKCHSIGGAGGDVGPDLGKLRTSRRATETAAALWNHGPAMWAAMKERSIPFPELDVGEISDIFAFLYFVPYLGERGDAERGKRLFREKSCFRCHPLGGEGPVLGPDLSVSDAVKSPFHWASAMWNHVPAMEAKVREKELPWPRFEDAEMRDLVEFLRSQRQ